MQSRLDPIKTTEEDVSGALNWKDGAAKLAQEKGEAEAMKLVKTIQEQLKKDGPPLTDEGKAAFTKGFIKNEVGGSAYAKLVLENPAEMLKKLDEPKVVDKLDFLTTSPSATLTQENYKTHPAIVEANQILNGEKTFSNLK